MTRALSLALALASACTAARYDRFEHYATGLAMGANMVATACDWGQTTHSSDHGRWAWGLTENNAALGHRPTLDKITAGLAFGVIGPMVATRTLPRGWRLAFAVVYTAAQLHNVSTQGEDPSHPRRACGF